MTKPRAWAARVNGLCWLTNGNLHSVCGELLLHHYWVHIQLFIYSLCADQSSFRLRLSFMLKDLLSLEDSTFWSGLFHQNCCLFFVFTHTSYQADLWSWNQPYPEVCSVIESSIVLIVTHYILISCSVSSIYLSDWYSYIPWSPFIIVQCVWASVYLVQSLAIWVSEYSWFYNLYHARWPEKTKKGKGACVMVMNKRSDSLMVTKNK